MAIPLINDLIVMEGYWFWRKNFIY